MAKFVCDFEQVKNMGEKMCTMASDLQDSISNGSSKIEGSLASWNGEAKSDFSSKLASQIKTAMQTATKAELTGEFIKKAAQSIEKLDDELATLSI